MRVEGEGSEGNSVSSSPLPPPPPPFIFFFVAPALTLALKLDWERLLRRLCGEEGRGRDLGRGVFLLPFFYSFPFPFLRLLPRIADIIRLL